MAEIFKKIILLGRPASGKSETMAYLKHTPIEERIKRFHVGKIYEIDDFPILWEWFEQDAILEKKLGKPRMMSTPDNDFIHLYQWNLLIEKLSFNYDKLLRDNPNIHDDTTVLIEFSRGSHHGGYAEAFKHLSSEILKDAVLVYINVPYEESLRKNRKRFNPDKPDSILEHGLPDAKLEELYKLVDWEEVSKGFTTHIKINEVDVPFMVFENMPSKTDDRELLGPELDRIFTALWKEYKK
jgi:hypothetical protein